jgi:hypothetical protein
MTRQFKTVGFSRGYESGQQCTVAPLSATNMSPPCRTIFDLLQDPHERYDIFMNNFTERTWALVPITASIQALMKTYVQYPPRKLQSMTYDAPIELSKFQKFQSVRENLQKEGINLPMPGN